MAKMSGVLGFRNRLECRKYILMAWAGPEAGLSKPRLTHTDLQLAQLSAKSGTRKNRKLVACYQLRARGIIERGLKSAIAAFAEILLGRETIDGHEAEQIILNLLKIERGASHLEKSVVRDQRRAARRG